MPIMKCNINGKPGFKYGDNGKCYAYTPGDKDSMKNARKQAIRQGLAIGSGKLEDMEESNGLQVEDTMEEQPKQRPIQKYIQNQKPSMFNSDFEPGYYDTNEEMQKLRAKLNSKQGQLNFFGYNTGTNGTNRGNNIIIKE